MCAFIASVTHIGMEHGNKKKK